MAVIISGRSPVIRLKPVSQLGPGTKKSKEARSFSCYLKNVYNAAEHCLCLLSQGDPGYEHGDEGVVIVDTMESIEAALVAGDITVEGGAFDLVSFIRLFDRK